MTSRPWTGVSTLISHSSLFKRAIAEVDRVGQQITEHDIDLAVDVLAKARRICVFGCGREGLQIRGFAMRLFHLGRSVAIVGDMTTPAIGDGDLLVVTDGPGYLPTVSALVNVAKIAGATVLTVTAQPRDSIAKTSDAVLVIPAQTMAQRQDVGTSLLPMGSIFEGALFFVFEVLIFRLKERFQVSDEVMWANHTNLE
jgi:6-phospho-3-hexuloisomerase